MNEMIKNETVTVRGKYDLEGTLTTPAQEAGKRPAILIIPGTGISDRDGNMKQLRMNIYKELAESISRLGFITLRYDKRGTHASGGSYVEAGFWDLVDDAEACVKYLESRADVDSERVLVLGHSEGAIIAPALNARHPLGGMILLAGMAEPGKEGFPKQSQRAIQELESMKGLKGSLLRLFRIPQMAQKQTVKTFAKILGSTGDTIRIQGKKINAKWFREHDAYNVLDDLEKVFCPVLAITGSKDLQVEPEHARVIAETVQGPSEWHIIPDMTHILKKTNDELTMLTLLKSYKKMTGEPFDHEMMGLIARWLERFKS
ncbi:MULTISPECIES: alpha/beta hydrolase [unclassified Paenibacillus]|uniref:alpha/beta hydrolase n=1 Tax=unclassified Paenibacillus TaxID=185978 RepID=UPI001AE57631|nr:MULTISPECIES: alpha/beta hydrolase [unclassified Paenibacillus]MBP1154520.1 pimeloyl-ACP methyl ester carboxylesterase [Paenibacillus sp. PvP091]MBP1170096.1 pimeloyl-ACP methyl ester carboxylesterase [Paenibacillus sp. PvR098]MBP2441124.1 pimeloyl-ACP methyl ester carboxylesterase [Paenibacillus sp. PvP052]